MASLAAPVAFSPREIRVFISSTFRDFVGRTANLRMLRKLGQARQRRPVTVSGIVGVGKTALAIEHAHAFADE